MESAVYTKAAKWNPNPPDNDLECTPLLLKTPRLVDDDNVSLGSSSTEIHQESNPNLSPRHTDRDSILESSLEEGSQPSNSPFESPEHSNTGTADDSHEEVSHPSQSSPSIPTIVTYEDDEPMETPEHLIQDRIPKVNDLISFYNEHLNAWVDAKITHDLSRKWNRYYNIQYLNG